MLKNEIGSLYQDIENTDMYEIGQTTRNGFTLVELLVVIGIIGVLVAMLLPAVQNVREAARRTSCSNNMKQCSLSVLSYESGNNHFPSGLTSLDSPRPYQSWLQAILPFIEEQAVFNQAERDYSTNSIPYQGHMGLQTVVSTYQCQSEPNTGVPHWTYQGLLVASTSYLGVNGLRWDTEDGVFYKDSNTRVSEISDGLSNTLMIGERPPGPAFWFGWWYTGLGQRESGSGDMLLGVREEKADGVEYLGSCPDGPYQFERGHGDQCDVLHFWSNHPGGAVFGMCDGSVHFLAYPANNVLPALATRAGQEAVQIPK